MIAMRVYVVAWAAALALVQGSGSPLLAQADLEPLLVRARAAAGRRDYPAVIDALQKALEEARRAAPLAVEKFVVVQEPARSYGDYVARTSTDFRAGEELHYYLEPKNLVYPRSADGTYRPAFDVGFEIVDKAGETVGKQERFGSFQFRSRSALQDIYVNLHLTLEGAPPGAYEIRFTVKDTNSAKTATVKQGFNIM
jgi:hypothetical protein